jgi:phage terminase large subunit-like protein
VGRRRKSLVDVVRDETFLARKDEYLLRGKNKLPWKDLDRFRRQFLAAAGDAERREISLELERGLRELGPAAYLGDLQAELDKLGPRDSFERLERFAPRFFRHQVGPLFGRRYHFPPNHKAFLREFWRRDRHGRRIYQVGLLMEPKGCSKTPTSAVLGTYTAVDELDSPDVFAIAGSKDQADIGHTFAKVNIEEGALAAWLNVGTRTIEYPANRGEFEILSSDGNLSAGALPAGAIFDELFLFTYQHHREAWNSQTKALHKRSGRAWVLGISTAGFDKQTLLGEIYDAAIDDPRIEERAHGFHLVLRDEKNGFLFWCHQAPDDADIEDPKVIRAATPAPWVKPRDLLRELGRADTDELDWRRLHLNQWTKTKRAWFPSGVWERLKGDSQIPEGAEITVGIDCARTHDTTSVSWAWVNPETGRKVERSHVWSLRRRAPHHVLVDADELDNENLVEPFVHELNRVYRVRGAAFDPRYFSTEARHLAAAGLTMIEVFPQSAAMTDAVTWFERDTLTGRIEHDGDPVVKAHIDAIDVVRTADGSKKIGKRSQEHAIDAGTSSILANYLTEIELPELTQPSEPWGATW